MNRSLIPGPHSSAHGAKALRPRPCGTLAGAALLLTLGVGPLTEARAATIVADELFCFLSEAITAANTDQAVGGCDAGSGADTIELEADVSLNVVNNTTRGDNGLPAITSEVTIAGNGHTIRREPSAPAFRLLLVDTGGDLTLDGVTLTGGRSAVLNYNGALSITDSLISDNEGDGVGVCCSGTAVITYSTISGNTGGGVVGSGGHGALSITDSVISDNEAGGVRAYHGATITRSTISGNSVGGDGGGVWSWTSPVNITNSTISGNSATGSGGGVWTQGYGSGVNAINSTISQNSAGAQGGGVWQGPYWRLTSVRSVISGNSAPVGAEVGGHANAASMVATDSLFGHDGLTNSAAFSGAGGGNTPDPSVNITATSDGNLPTALADILGPLQDNGGPTDTHALVIGSPAIDAVSVGPATDQRGVARPKGSDYDIGAFEYVSPEEAVADLTGAVEDLVPDYFTGRQVNVLLYPLNLASRLLAQGRTEGACGQLLAFTKEVAAKTPNPLDAETADALLGAAEGIRTDLGCL